MKTYFCLNRTILLAFGYFALLPMARAVNPPPDGCYSQLTTAEGCNALFSLGIGQGNTAIGHDALFSDMEGSWNTSVGAVALGSNNADSNTAVGAAALLLNTTGESNTGIGAFALLYNNGNSNTAIGFRALYSNSIGHDNTATGKGALDANINGNQNTATGVQALLSNTDGSNNTADGLNALYSNTIGAHNTAVGTGALFNNMSGDGNVAVGEGAGINQTTGSNNLYIGAGVAGLSGENNRVRIADNLPTGAAESACYIGGIHLQDPGFPNNPVLIGFDGKLGITGSSKRFKEHIKPMAKASESILALKPITFHYKSDAKKTPCFGLIAEEVAAVNPDLVVRDKDGEIYSVRYDAVNAMLLNEFLKEHKKVQNLEATVAQQQKAMEILTTQIKGQALQIEKVADQLQAIRSVPQLVLNEQ